MNVGDLIHHLPEKPPKEMEVWAKTFDDELGSNLLVFHRESLEIAPPLKRTMSPKDREEHLSKTVRRWGAVCTCTCCLQEFEAGWVSNPKARVKGIRILMGEYGFFPGYVEPGDDDSIEVAEGETVICPFCECEVRLIASSSIYSGRTWQMLLGNVDTIGEYTVIMTWLYRRQLTNDGALWSDIRPARAIAVTKRNGLARFDHVKANSYGGTYDLPNWVASTAAVEDPFLMLYYNCDAINHKQVGGRMWTRVPNIAGTTAEKTGLAEYVKKGGCWPVAYLKLWKQQPYTENLVKSDFGRLLVQDIGGQIDSHLSYGYRSSRVHVEWADLAESKPHRMLGMTRAEARDLKGKSLQKLSEWQRYRYYSGRVTAAAFFGMIDRIGIKAMETINAYGSELADEGWVEKAVRYIEKQKNLTAPTAAELLCDLWDMLEEESQGRIITEEELWPRDLRAAHDRLAEERQLMQDAKKNAEYAAGFRAIQNKYGALEWTDGELCVCLPRKNSDLKEEGATLHHCVGGYGKGHIEERTVVFFIRHYRRPERSYYTTDYCFTGNSPRRNQLHGYGNEHHGEHKQYRHTIPKKVTEFLDRWEREVLLPWHKKHIQNAEKAKNKRSA